MLLLLGHGRNQSFGGLLERKTEGGGDACAIGGIGPVAVGDMALHHLEARAGHGAGGVLEQEPLLVAAHLPEQDAGLVIVIIVDAMVPPGRVALDRRRRLDQRLVTIHPRTLAVGPVGRRRAEVAVGPHRAIAVIAVERAFW